MWPGLLVRLRPAGPWRIGPDSGARDRAGNVYHSDALFAAVSSAMTRLGMLESWLDATVRAPVPAVSFSSCFPWQRDTLYIIPPRSIWPPPPSAKLRAKGARFIPVSLVASLLADQPLDEDAWVIEGHSLCLKPREKDIASVGPFRVALRSNASVDRTSGANIEVHRTACLEFADDAGLWALVRFEDENSASIWTGPVETAFRWLADAGFGGERSLGWGRSAQPEFTRGIVPDLVLPAAASSPGDAPTTETGVPPPPETAYWLLSLFSPAEDDPVDWQRGSYALVDRGGRIESTAGWGAPKKLLRMVEEGSVLLAPAPPRGVARDVAPDGFPHPVYRAGFAFAIPISWRLPS